MTRVPDNMSEADGMMEDARELIERRYYPVLAGPRPAVATLLALAFVNATFLLLPAPETLLAASAAMFFASALTALRLRTGGGRRIDVVSIALLATIAFGWAYAVYSGFAAYTAVLHHAVLSSAALVFGFARYLRSFRYSWSAAMAAAPACDSDGLANYAEYLLDHRPGPASRQVAREFYRIASEEVLQHVDPAPRHIGLLKRYIDLLQSGVGGYADLQEAAWWMERVRELEDGVRVPVSCGFREQTGWFDARETPAGIGDGALGYDNGRPVWRLRVANPVACETCEATIAFRAFLLPEAGLIACLLRLHPESGEPVVAHRVFDVSDPDTEAFMMASEHRLTWRIELRRGRGGQPVRRQKVYDGDRPAQRRRIDLRGTGFMECLDAAIRHNGERGADLDGAAALEFFATTLASHAGEDRLEAAWAAIDAACLRFEE